MNLLVFFIHFSRRASTYCTRTSISQIASKQIQHETATLFRSMLSHASLSSFMRVLQFSTGIKFIDRDPF